MQNFESKAVEYYYDMVEKCDPKGLECMSGCKEVLEGIYAKEPCLGNEKLRPLVIQFSIDDDDKSFVNMLVSCSAPTDDGEDGEDGISNGGTFENSLCPQNDGSGAGDNVKASVFFVAISYLLWLIG